MQDNDGERELVLGNKQLLAIFFAATLLCGVFFAVGYVVGGNSAKSVANTTAANTDSSASSTDGKREEPAAPAPETATPTTVAAALADTGGLPSAEPHIRDNPASSTSAPSRPTPAPPVAAAPEPVKTSNAATYQTAPANNSSTGVFISVPEQGASYVQVSATSRPSADSLVKILRDGSLPAILAASSKPDLFEVLVGPYRTPFSLAEAKRKLTDLGYNGTVARKF
jgi:hypothetical protein